MSDLINRIYGDFEKKNEIPKVKIPKFATGGICNDAIFPKLDAFSQIDEIVKDIAKKKDNAMAIEFTKCIGEMLKKNGVLPKLTEYTRNFETDRTFETKYGVSIDELDFSAHDKVFEDKIATLEEKLLTSANAVEQNRRRSFVLEMKNQDLKNITKGYEDKIAELENIINHKLGNWDKHGITYQEILDMKAENDLLKQRIAELESKETSELPFDALETANYLINATYERETSSLERIIVKTPDKVNSDRYTIDDLEQIAEHLLVYCKHNKECEE